MCSKGSTVPERVFFLFCVCTSACLILSNDIQLIQLALYTLIKRNYSFKKYTMQKPTFKKPMLQNKIFLFLNLKKILNTRLGTETPKITN